MVQLQHCRLCSHSQNGVQGRSPCKRNDVILRARPQTCGARRISCRPSCSSGGAVPLRSGLLCIRRCTRFAHQNFTQIIILRIDRTNEIAFLLPSDPFEGFFSCYCFVYIVVFFIVHQFVDVIPCGISEFVHFVFVFLIAADNIVCYTHIKNTISFVCFNVNVICFCVHSDYIRLYNFVF